MDPKERFSSRVENYIKYRPKYPWEVINFLIEKELLLSDSIVADIGSGTGILSELFLKNGNLVYGVEPNKDMRAAAEKLLSNYANFNSVEGSAENTGLKENSIDLITAGQAFHWFDVKKTKKEFIRIIKPMGYVVLIWNNRRKTAPGFPSESEQLLLKYGKDYKEVQKTEKNIERFFQFEKKIFYNFQDVNLEEYKGRILSASYIPLEDDPNYKRMISDFENLFKKYQRNGLIRIEYDTEIYYGKI
ncbi:MAG: class I SAM-dependent methyltransferase [Candidatus Heimdallarchaeota archaeon]